MTRNVVSLILSSGPYRPYHPFQLFVRMLRDPIGRVRAFDEQGRTFDWKKVGFLTWERGEEFPF